MIDRICFSLKPRPLTLAQFLLSSPVSTVVLIEEVYLPKNTTSRVCFPQRVSTNQNTKHSATL